MFIPGGLFGRPDHVPQSPQIHILYNQLPFFPTLPFHFSFLINSLYQQHYQSHPQYNSADESHIVGWKLQFFTFFFSPIKHSTGVFQILSGMCCSFYFIYIHLISIFHHSRFPFYHFDPSILVTQTLWSKNRVTNTLNLPDYICRHLRHLLLMKTSVGWKLLIFLFFSRLFPLWRCLQMWVS